LGPRTTASRSAATLVGRAARTSGCGLRGAADGGRLSRQSTHLFLLPSPRVFYPRTDALWFFRDPQLPTLSSFHPLFIAGTPSRASAIYSIVPYLESQGGVWFARGGMYAVVEGMHALFSRLGGETRLSIGLEEVLVDDATRRTSGARLATGESLGADAGVLNADVATAYTQLVPQRYDGA
jgi:phytoene dehydrogenase-like protein